MAEEWLSALFTGNQVSPTVRRVLFMFLGPNVPVSCFYRENVSGIQILNSYKLNGGSFF